MQYQSGVCPNRSEEAPDRGHLPRSRSEPGHEVTSLNWRRPVEGLVGEIVEESVCDEPAGLGIAFLEGPLDHTENGLELAGLSSGETFDEMADQLPDAEELPVFLVGQGRVLRVRVGRAGNGEERIDLEITDHDVNGVGGAP